MSLNPVLTFNGNCKEAFHFYAKAFGGRLAFLMTWGSSPKASQVPAGWHEKILIGRVNTGSSEKYLPTLRHLL